MRKSLFAAAFIFATIVAAQAASPAPPPELAAARKAFAAAVAAHDVNAVAKLSSFPLVIDVYQSPPRVSQKQFLAGNKQFSAIFGDGDKGIVDCLRGGALAYQGDAKDPGANPDYAKSWVADCNGNEYYFANRHGEWLFIGYQNINE